MTVCGGMVPPRGAETISAGLHPPAFHDLTFMFLIDPTQLRTRGQRCLLM